IELAADDAEAGRARPRRLVPPALELEDAGLERLDGERILLGIDLQIAESLRGDPARADLDSRKNRRVEHEHAQARAGEPPGRPAASGPAAHHDDLEAHDVVAREAHCLTPSRGRGEAAPSGAAARAGPRPGWRAAGWRIWLPRSRAARARRPRRSCRAWGRGSGRGRPRAT